MAAAGAAKERGEGETVSPPLADTLDEGLEKLFGFSEFRAGQREVMETVLEGHNVLVVMPTGSGKSLCFQLPACLGRGITLVISPLIALMKDQVDALQGFGLPATFINSSLSWSEQKRRLVDVESGRYKMLYVAPERFKSGAFLDTIAKVDVGMMAIDEAHCISQWGHDFRPDYLELARVRHELGDPPTMALTATATSFVQRDILTQLDMPQAQVRVSGFERPNLFFEIFHARSREDKRNRMLALLDHVDGESAVIYCATRRQCEEVHRELQLKRITAGIYHGGMTDGQREASQDAWMSGDVPVLVATNAFGMGVDKPDVRAIVHYNMPGSMEAYYQEAGRAGRDGHPSHCLLLFNYADKRIHEFFSEQSYPERGVVERVWSYLTGLGGAGSTHALGTDQIARALSTRGNRVHPMGIDSALRLLQRAAHIDMGTRDGFPWIAILDHARTRDLRVDWESLKNRRDVAEQQFGDVVTYASKHECRQVQILRYFNSTPSFGQRCGWCDCCAGPPEYAEAHVEANRRRIIIDDTGDVLLKKLLSGVYRAQGRWGAHQVAGMLRGSRSKKVRQAGLDRLSTYGVLRSLKQDDIVHLLDILTRHRLIARTEHGAIKITEQGNLVVRDIEEPGEALQGELAATIETPTRLKRSPRSSQSAVPTLPRPETGDTYSVTWELVQQDLDYPEIARRREVTTDTILRHFIVLADRGKPLDLSQHLDGSILPAMREIAAAWHVGDQLSPLMEAMPLRCSYDQLKIHLAQVLLERRQEEARG